jgi:hypothetical protein
MRKALLLCVPAAVLGCATLASAAGPAQGTVFGQVTSVKGKTFVLKTAQSPTGQSKVDLSSSTTISEQVAAKQSDLVKGVCVFATGQREKNGTISATTVGITTPVKGSCQMGFGQRGRRPGNRPPGARPRNGRPPGNFQRPANFGFATGGITDVKGDTITVHNQRGSTNVAVSSKTQISKTSRVDDSAIKVNECAIVRGTSADAGVTVAAQNVNLRTAGKNGCTGFRFGR